MQHLTSWCAPSRRRAPIVLAPLLCLLLIGTPLAFGQFVLTDVNPSWSDLDPTDPNGGTAGRVSGIASVRLDNDVFYAASEWGGLYKSYNGGRAWVPLEDHLPKAMWDVEVNPIFNDRVYATSFYDGRVNSLAGINISLDAGLNWIHPATAIPPPGFCQSGSAQTELSAFGISVYQFRPAKVYVGTNCGLAISEDLGDTWSYVDTDPSAGAGWVYDVVAHSGGLFNDGIIDVCGSEGHQRSLDGGATWSVPSGDPPGGLCSIAVSPDDEDVLFVTVGQDIYESDDGGATWIYLGTPDSRRSGRVPFVETNQRSDEGDEDRFDLWFGDVFLYRGRCVSNPPGGGQRCPTAFTGDPSDPPPPGWAGPLVWEDNGHGDVGDVLFDPEAGIDACPVLFSSDGGVYYNKQLDPSLCHDPLWEQPDFSPHGLWLWAMTGANQSGDAFEDLYFACQDVGTFGTQWAGVQYPPWHNENGADAFDTAADPSRVLYTHCCFDGRANLMFLGPPGMAGSPEINTYPADGLIDGFHYPDVLDVFGPGQYAVITSDCTPGEGGCPGVNGGDGGIYVTHDVSAVPIVWTEIGDATEPPTGGDPRACAINASASGGVPTFYVQVGTCDGRGTDVLWRFVGTDPTGSWDPVSLPPGGISLLDVDPGDPDRLLAVSLPAGGDPRVYLSETGGPPWRWISALDTLMTGGGEFKYRNSRGPTMFTGFQGYPQPSLVAFDPEDPEIMVAAGRDSGVFLSTDRGETWLLVTDPHGGDPTIPHLPRPWYAYFDHESVTGQEVNMYIGTNGRGVWRVTFGLHPTADANGPYETDEGSDVALDGSASSDPDGWIASYEWDFDDDGEFDDATGAKPDFDPIGDGVGQDGVYPVRLKVTDNDGLTSVDESLVTVHNVAPTVSLSSNSPRNELDPVTVSGTVTDPGWLENLTATINWGDGSPIEVVSGTLEQVRPDATLSFNISHIYGDNGTFTAEVCGYDDDTSSCATIGLEILNVPPTAEIDGTAVVDGCGGDAFIAHAGDEVSFTGHSTDPGSDDLTLTWVWGDGTADTSTDYLVNPPNPDPFPSPSIQPRDVTDTQTHNFNDACIFEITFSSTDDDGGSALDSEDVVIVGNAELIRSAGYWSHQYRGRGRIRFSPEELQCYLDIVNHLSSVFSEETDASDLDAAEEVLDPSHSNGEIRVQFDRQLLAVWLNFANGAIEYDELVDTDFDLVPDTELITFLCAAEAARLNPATTDSELEDLKDLLEAINLLDD